jgi:hypothetical protein
MINGKITEHGTGKTYQPGVCFTEQRQISISGGRAFDKEVWGVSNPGVSLCSASQRDDRKDGYPGSFRGVYCKNTFQSDHQDKKVCEVQRALHQQSSPISAGRFFSQERSWPKNRGKLKYHFPTIACGSKSFLRCIVFSSRPISKISILNIPVMN